MSRLGDLENTIITRLSAVTVLGGPAFRTIRGVSGGFRPALRDALRREVMPAAYVAFIDEATAPETSVAKRGARFSVLIAVRILRAGENPRHGDATAAGAFELLDKARQELDFYSPPPGILEFQPVHEKFVDADDRVAVYEVLYRAWPVVAGLTFAGEELVGSDSTMTLEVGPVRVEQAEFRFPGLAGVYRRITGVGVRPLVWRGQLRAADDAGLDAIESDIESRIVTQQMADVAEAGGRTFADCVLERFVRLGPRRRGSGGEFTVQEAELQFCQLNPA